MGDIEGPILRLLLMFMYGLLQSIPKEAFLPLFIAADAHQAGADKLFHSAWGDLCPLQCGMLHCRSVPCGGFACSI